MNSKYFQMHVIMRFTKAQKGIVLAKVTENDLLMFWLGKVIQGQLLNVSDVLAWV